MIGRVRSMNGRWLLVAVIAAMFMWVGSAVSTHYVETRRAERSRQDLCQAQNESRAALRDVLILARSLPRQRPYSAEDQRMANAFYVAALKRVQPIDCSDLSKGE